MKKLSVNDVEYHREYSKQHYIKKQLGEIGTVPRLKKLPYCYDCKTRASYDLLPAEGGLLQRVCHNCGQGDLYVSGSLPAR